MMKKLLLTALSLVSLHFISASAYAATYYVDAGGGDDNNNGSTSTPWKSISKAASTLTAGDIVIIRAGVYRETVTPKNSGKEGSRITYKAEPGAEVIITGTDPLTSSWSQHSGNIYKTSVQLPLGDGNQLFVNDNMMMEASWPNNPSTASSNAWLLERNLSNSTEGTEISTSRYSLVGGAVHFNVPVGSRIYISPMLNHGWYNYTGDVVGYDSGTKRITFEAAPDPAGHLKYDVNKVSYNKGVNARKALFFLYGHLSYLDMEKEYFYDPIAAKLYLYQPGGGIPSANNVEYKARNTGINLSGRNFITVQGISLFACNLISDNNSGNIIIDRIKGRYLSHWSTSDIPQEVVGMRLTGPYNEIRNSDLSYSMGCGIELSGDNSKIINNRITDCNYLGLYRNNISLNGSEHVVSYNTVVRSGRSILGGKFADSKISYNEFAYANYLSADGACLYLGFWDTGNSEVSYNYVHHPGSPGSNTTGIYFDNYCHNAIIHHNYTEGMQINGPRSGMTMVNNTIIGRGLVWDYWVKDVNGNYIFEEDGSGTYIANNIVSQNGMILNRIQPVHDIMNWDETVRGVGTAKLLDSGSLNSGSPCIDPAGVVMLPHIHASVIDGKPDLGAFEYGVTPWAFGHDFFKIREDQLTDFNFPMMNQMENPGFEKGPEGWMNSFSTSSGKRGKGALIAANSHIHQTVVGLKPDSTYQVAAWSRQSGGGIPVLEVRNYGGNDVSKTGDSLGTEWTLNEFKIKTGPSSTSAVIYLRNTGSGSVIWDQAGIYIQLQNIQVGEVPPSDPSIGLATQSSTDWGGEAARAIDGNTSGIWGENSVTHTKAETNPWWTLDRGESSYLTQIRIWNRTDAAPERLSDFYVFVSDEPFASTDPAVLAVSPGVWKWHYQGMVDGSDSIPVGTSGRYIRIQIPGQNKVLSLAEIEIFVGDSLISDSVPSITWIHLVSGNASGSWADAANWSGGTVPALNDTADLSTLNITANSSVSLNGNRSINKLLFADATTATHSWTVVSGSPSSSSLTLGGTSPEVSVSNQSATITALLAGSENWAKTGAGTLTLKNGSNTFTGDIMVQNGTLVDFQNSLGDPTGKTVVDTTSGGKLRMNSYGLVIDVNEPVLLQGSGGNGAALTFSGSAGGVCNMNGPITLDGSGDYELEVYLQPSHWKINGGIARSGTNVGTLKLDLAHWQQTTPVRLTVNSTIDNNGGPVELLGNSAGILRMDAASHDLGGFTINGAYTSTFQTILQLGISNALNPSQNLTLTKGIFDLAGFDQTVNGLSGVVGNSRVTNTGTMASTLTVGNGGGSATFSGNIEDGSAAISLMKTGGGSQTLAGLNSYSGDTTVGGGTLILRAINTTDELATVTIAAGASLGLDFTGTDTVNKLFLGSPAVQVAAGIYNAAHPTYAAYFSFGGSLEVTSGPVSGDTLAPVAAQSSTGWGGEAARAIDGNTNGNWGELSVTHTETESNPSWTLDRGESSYLTHIKIWNRTDAAPERLSDFYVFVSDQPFASTDPTVLATSSGVWKHYYDGMVNGSDIIPVGTRGRYIRIQIPGADKVLSLAEVEVFEDYPTLYSSWTERMGLSGALAEANADPMGVGFSNLLRYAFGMSLEKIDLDHLPRFRFFADDNGLLRHPGFCFYATDSQDINYSVEVSSDLKNWSFLPDSSVLLERDPLYQGLRKVKVKVLEAGAGESTTQFYRLHVKIVP